MFFKKVFVSLMVLFCFSIAKASTPKSTGKYKSWESFVVQTDKGKICFAQTVPTKRAPGSIKRDKSKLFVTFRPSDEIKDEVSLTSGHDYKTSSVTVSSGKRRYSFFSQKNFAWLLDDQEERKFIQLMKLCSNKFKCKFFLAAGSNEIEEQIVSKILNSEHKDNCVTLNKLRISETLPIIKNCNISVCNDTSFSHLSAALGVETIVLMTDTPLLYGNYSSKMHPILPDGEKIVTHDTLGKDKINSETIFNKLKNILKLN